MVVRCEMSRLSTSSRRALIFKGIARLCAAKRSGGDATPLRQRFWAGSLSAVR